MSPLKLYEEEQFIWLIFYRTGRTIAVKGGQLGDNADTFMPIFSADNNRYMFLQKGIKHFF